MSSLIHKDRTGILSSAQYEIYADWIKKGKVEVDFDQEKYPGLSSSNLWDASLRRLAIEHLTYARPPSKQHYVVCQAHLEIQTSKVPPVIDYVGGG